MVTNLNLSYPQALQLLKNCRFHPVCAGKAGARGRRGLLLGEERSPRHRTPDTSHVPCGTPSSRLCCAHRGRTALASPRHRASSTGRPGPCAPRHRSLLLPWLFLLKGSPSCFREDFGCSRPAARQEGRRMAAPGPRAVGTPGTAPGPPPGPDGAHRCGVGARGSGSTNPSWERLRFLPLSPKEDGQASVLPLPQASLNKRTRP